MVREPSRFDLHETQDRLLDETPSFKLKDGTYKPLADFGNHIIRLRNANGWEKSRKYSDVGILSLNYQDRLAEGQLAIGDTRMYVDISRIKSVEFYG